MKLTNLKITYLLMLILVIFNLSACQHAIRDESYFVLHPDQIEPVYERCEKLLVSEAQQDAECMAAIQAAQQIKPLVLMAIQKPSQYGAKILAAQSELATKRLNLQNENQTLASLQKAGNSAAIEKQQQKINDLQQQIITQQNSITTMQNIIKFLHSAPE